MFMRPKADWIAIFIVIGAALLTAGVAHAEPMPYAEKLADAIYRQENSVRYPYGIKSINTRGNAAAARAICLATIRNNWRRWRLAGSPGEYVDFLAARYCPPSEDPIGNANWRRNIKKFLGNA